MRYAIAMLAVLMATPVCVAQETKERSIEELIEALENPKESSKASEELIQRGDKAVPALIGEAVEGKKLVRRGWAIVCLGEIGGAKPRATLEKLFNDDSQEMLIRTWAVGGLVQMADSTEQLVELSKHIPKFPALGRPIGMKLLDLMKNSEPTAEDLINLSLKIPTLQQTLGKVLADMGPEKLGKAMATSNNQNVRRTAAGYLAALGQKNHKEVAEAVIKLYKFDPEAKKLAWDGGPLFLPGLQWDKDQTKELLNNLMKWMLWIELNGKEKELMRPIINNMNSINFTRYYRYQMIQDQDAAKWLANWGAAVGKEEIEKILKEQNAADKEKYKKVLEGLK